MAQQQPAPKPQPLEPMNDMLEMVEKLTKPWSMLIVNIGALLKLDKSMLWTLGLGAGWAALAALLIRLTVSLT